MPKYTRKRYRSYRRRKVKRTFRRRYLYSRRKYGFRRGFKKITNFGVTGATSLTSSKRYGRRFIRGRYGRRGGFRRYSRYGSTFRKRVQKVIDRNDVYDKVVYNYASSLIANVDAIVSRCFSIGTRSVTEIADPTDFRLLGSSGLAYSYTVPDGRRFMPGSVQAIINQFTPPSNGTPVPTAVAFEKYKIRQDLTQITFENQFRQPVTLKCYWVKYRTSVDAQAIDDLEEFWQACLANDFPGIGTNFYQITPFMSQSFVSRCKITSSRTYSLGPAATKSFILKSAWAPWNFKKSGSYIYTGQTLINNYNNAKKSRHLLVIAHPRTVIQNDAGADRGYVQHGAARLAFTIKSIFEVTRDTVTAPSRVQYFNNIVSNIANADFQPGNTANYVTQAPI